MIRNIRKHKVFTAINWIGLSLGMGVCLLLGLYIQHELGYDQLQERGNQIYRLAMARKYPGRVAMRGGIPVGIGPASKKEFPEIKEFTRIAGFGEDMSIRAGGKTFTDKWILIVDSNFFQVFSGEFLEGNVHDALQAAGMAVINESTAIRYFGSPKNAMNKEITINGKLTITGVCKDWPEKSHIRFDILVSNAGSQDWNRPEYIYFGPHCYLLLNKDVSANLLQSKLPSLVEKYVAPLVEKTFGEPYKQFIAEGNGYDYFLQPLSDIHLHSELEDELLPTTRFKTIFYLGVIGVFILILACINFVNLSTAISTERAREVGIRKTFGSGKRELVWQFLSESVFLSLASAIGAFMLVTAMTPVFKNISGFDLSISYFLSPFRMLFIFGFAISIGIMAGLYPSFVLSSFNPNIALKAKLVTSPRGVLLRNSLVIFQFSISIILIICTIMVSRQMQFVMNEQPGFRKDHIIEIDAMYRIRMVNSVDARQSFLDAIAGIPGVESISKCDGFPGTDDGAGGATWVCVGNNYNRTEKLLRVDENYQDLLGLELREGRFFSEKMATDSISVVLNEQAVADFGIKNPIGAKLISKEPFLNPDDGNSQHIFTVIGVVKDYHYQSMHQKIAPLIMVNSNKFGWGSAGIRITGVQLQEALTKMEARWKKYDARHEFLYHFLDQQWASQYLSEVSQQKVFSAFSFLAFIISCIGLFGLSSYAARKRAKELSIRKILGATPLHIFIHLAGGFLRLILISACIASPLSWWAVNKWLEKFAYRVSMPWSIFILAGGMAAVLAFATIIFQAIKSSMVNPIIAIRNE